MIYLTKIKARFSGGHARTAKANRHIVYSFLIKGMSIGCQFALVPLTLHYLDTQRYGIWLTMASIVGWFSFFDVGIGNGLRNKLSEALAKGDNRLAKVYISTSYACVAAIFLTLMLLFWVVSPFLNWASILNTPQDLAGELSRMMLVVFSFFCLQFILNLIGNILYAHQEPALTNLIAPLGNVVSLIVIYILTLTTHGSLFWVSVVFSASPVCVLLLFNLIFLGWKYRAIAPGIRHIRLRHSRDLFGLGFQFFVIQIAFIVMYSTANILLIRWFDPSTVTVYNIAYKYFTIALLANGIITATYWSAFTDAYVRQEFDWVRNTIRRMEKVTYLLMVMVLVQTALAGPLIGLWLHHAVRVPLSMQVTMCVYTVISLIAAPQHIFLNGTGKIRLQLYTAIYTIVMDIPFAWLFCKVLHLGPKGVILAMICTSLPVTILYRIQYNKIMSGKATGIWVK
ncbi:MAG TPA: MATE family efflux transporter [Puia sp.]|nr:MATE family efflux transporter [Puia sp.]